MPKVLGIDVGNTNACVAVMEGGEPVVIPNEGARTTPSMVALTKQGERLIGEAAKRQAITNPRHTISSLMRFIGRPYDDPMVQHDKRFVPYNVVRASNGDAWIEMQGRAYSPPEIVAMILQKLKWDAEAYLGERVTQAVMALPCYFDSRQRQAMKDAGRIAGFEILRFLHHTTAAALGYGLDKKKDERIAIYDLGGGTLNISILELGEGVFEVKSVKGDLHLGGDDFDLRLVTWLADEFKKAHGIDLSQDRMVLPRLKEAAEKAKKELSSAMQTEINLSAIAADASGPRHLTMTLTRSKLEQLVEDLIEKTRGPVMMALSDAGARAGDINEVVLVGGQTRMLAIQTQVRRIFEREPYRGVNPDEVVATGAAIQAGVLTGDVKDVLVLDVAPLSLGIETPGGVFTRLIECNTTIPTQKSQVFSTNEDNQPSFEVNILEGEREFAKDNRSLGSFILDGIAPAPRGVPQIEVTFDIDTSEILTVSARDKGTGRQQKITAGASGGLSREQVDRMGREAEAYEREYKEHQEQIEERNLAEGAVYRVEKIILELGNKLTSGQKSELESRIAGVRLALARSNIASIKSAREALEQSISKISEALYRKEASPEEAKPLVDQKDAFSLVGQQMGNYRLLRQLGRGGFATVYLGEHRYLKINAAIKVLHTHMQQNAIQAFLQEAQAIAHLKHQYIVRVLDFGIEHATPFLVMEYAAHGTLRDRHPHGARLAPVTIVSYVRHIASALHYAHQQKIVHRDVKPENMLLEADGAVLLSDFGIVSRRSVSVRMQQRSDSKPRPRCRPVNSKPSIRRWERHGLLSLKRPSARHGQPDQPGRKRKRLPAPYPVYHCERDGEATARREACRAKSAR